MKSLTEIAQAALPDHDLTGVELDMLGLAGLGMTNKEVAVHYKTTEQVIKNRWKMILAKMHCRNRCQACVVAAKRGWIG